MVHFTPHLVICITSWRLVIHFDSGPLPSFVSIYVYKRHMYMKIGTQGTQGTLGSFGCSSLFNRKYLVRVSAKFPPAESPTTMVFFSGKPSLMRWRCITRQRVNFNRSRKRGDGSLSRLSLPTEAILDAECSTKRRT